MQMKDGPQILAPTGTICTE